MGYNELHASGKYVLVTIAIQALKNSEDTCFSMLRRKQYLCIGASTFEYS